MKNAYLAICYICNENCSFCPCSKNEKNARMITPLLELKETIDSFVNNRVSDITISGGEPTLHPNLPEIIHYAQKKGLHVTVLSNGERFSNKEFMKVLSDYVDIPQVRLITTLHSEKEDKHENVNMTNGSFTRSINGMLQMVSNGAKVIVKHCITKENYKDLCSFYKFCDLTFPQNVDVQLCSIDYCGIPKELLVNEMLTFPALRPHLEQLFDYHIERTNAGYNRKLYCINMPLCSCDAYYWSYIPKRRKKMYNAYKDPHSREMKVGVDIVGTDELLCTYCKAYPICCGTYKTAFEYFGEKIIKPYI